MKKINKLILGAIGGVLVLLPSHSLAVTEGEVIKDTISILDYSLHNRVSEVMTHGGKESKMGAYINFGNSSSKVKGESSSDKDALKTTLNLIEVGADYQIMPNNYVGLVIQQVGGDNKFASDYKSKIKSTSFGLYYMGIMGEGYFMDASFKYAGIKQDNDTKSDSLVIDPDTGLPLFDPDTGDLIFLETKDKFTNKHSAMILTIDGGKKMSLNDGYFLTPTAGLTMSIITTKDYKSSNGFLNNKIDPITLVNLKFGAVGGKSFQVGNGTLQPYAKAYLSTNIIGEEKHKIIDPDSTSTIKNDIKGGMKVMLGAGVDYSLEIMYPTTISFDVSMTQSLGEYKYKTKITDSSGSREITDKETYSNISMSLSAKMKF